MKTEEKLDKVSELQATIELNREYYNKLRREALPEDVRTALDKIDVEFNEKQAEVGKQISELETEVKLDVIAQKTTIHGKFLMTVYNKARETVNMEQLRGYAITHPEVNMMMKIGEPTCTIRKIGKGE